MLRNKYPSLSGAFGCLLTREWSRAACKSKSSCLGLLSSCNDRGAALGLSSTVASVSLSAVVLACSLEWP